MTRLVVSNLGLYINEFYFIIRMSRRNALDFLVHFHRVRSAYASGYEENSLMCLKLFDIA